MLACWFAFVAASVLLLAWRWTAVAALVAALASFALTRALLPAVAAPDGPPARPAWDLPFFPGMSSMAVFCFVVALALVPLGYWSGFLLAVAVVIPA